MFVGIVGGNLQGVEAAYLGGKAGWRLLVVDKDPRAPAAGLADEFACLEIVDGLDLTPALGKVDLVLPALEDQEVLDWVYRWCRQTGKPCCFDPRAYAVSSSKKRSDRLFADLGLPAPRPWPQAEFPVVIKPSGASGSQGVRLCRTREELHQFLGGTAVPEDLVVQEFVWGPSYSIEVVGLPGDYLSLEVTDLCMDDDFDCKRVVAPSGLDAGGVAAFRQMALELAAALELRGLMDVEVILHQGRLKVLEIDARLPSQTPTAVYWSAGINMVEILARLFSEGRVPEVAAATTLQGVIYEHLQVTPGRVQVGGEHLMSKVGPLSLVQGFFGAEEALTNFTPGAESWVATLIVTGPDRQAAWERRQQVISALCSAVGVDSYLDPEPPLPWGQE